MIKRYTWYLPVRAFLSLFPGCLPECDYIVMKLIIRLAVQSKFTRITTTRVSLLMIIYSPNITKGSVYTGHMLGSRVSKYKAGREETHVRATIR